MPGFARGSSSWLATALLGCLLGLGLWRRTGSLFALVVGALGGFTLLFFIVFFRDPDRKPAPGVASPADGRVVRLDVVDDPLLGTCDRLSIFMSPLDVHVNRFPLDGRVESVTHIAGGHIPAWDKDSHRNERVETVIDTSLGRVRVVQIAGTVARRIVPYITGGESAVKGFRMGLIRLGSRCDLYVPQGRVRWTVALKQQVYGGTTQVAEATGPTEDSRPTESSRPAEFTGSPEPA